VDQLLDIQPLWEGVVELVDDQRLVELTNCFCAGQETSWDF